MNENTAHYRIGLHIGLPKTGTTSLQENCFSKHPDLAYFGQTNFRQNDDANYVLRALLGVETDTNNRLAKQAIGRAFENKQALMISDEAMTMGEFMVRAKHWSIQTNHLDNAKRAKALLGNAPVFIVFRNQFDWLISWHQQGLFSKKYTNSNFDEWFNIEFAHHIEALLALLDYQVLYTAYTDVFGADKVSVYFYEQYQSQGFGDLAADVATKLGVDPLFAKVTMGHSAKNISKMRQAVECYSIHLPTTALKKKIIKRFNQSNRALIASLRTNPSINFNEFESKYIFEL